MLGLFGSLDMAARSLSVQQEEMAISGQNVSNANNASYAEEQLVTSQSTPLYTTIGYEGTGIQMTDITSSRNPLIDSQIQAETSVTGSLNLQQSSLQNAEAYLNETITSSSSSSAANSPNGLAAGLSNLFDSFQSLSANPSDTSLRQTTISAAQQMASQFNQVSSQLSTVQQGLNTSIQNDVASANQNLSAIATLNSQIVAAQAAGTGAPQLVDEREQALESLAGFANISTTTQANGAVDVSIGGHAMVTGGTAADSLQTYADGNGNLQVQSAATGAAITLTGGSIEGAFTSRDGALASLQGGLNTLASQLITQVNTVYSAGYDLHGNTGQNFFTGSSAANIGVNSSVANDPSQFQAAGTAGATGDNTVALSLAELGSQNISGLGNLTFSGSYANTVSNLGAAISTVNDKLNSSQAVTQMLTTARASPSGVSVDQEMPNLLQYQKAYAASAEVITTLNEMMQTLNAMKTV